VVSGESKTGYAFLLPALAVIAFVYAYPVAKVIEFSLRHGGTGGWVALDNYRALSGDPIFWQAVENNLLLFLLIPVLIFLSLVFSSLLYERVRGWRVYRFFIFMPYLMPVVVAGMAFGYLLQYRGAVNRALAGAGAGAQDWLGDPRFALFSVGGVILWRELGFGVILFLARMMQVSGELYESARIDGAGWWQTLYYVTIPQLRTVIAFYASVIAIQLFSWVFSYVFVLTRGGPGFSTYVSEFYIYQRAFNYDEIGVASACSVVIVLLVAAGMSGFFGLLRRAEVFD
jgi:ABC-type sugar transport system permease subunit